MKLLTAALVGTSALGSSVAVDPLSSYNCDLNGTSVSGLSSGAFFAVQMHVAFSSFIVGAGVFAGGPYDCAKGSLTTAEMTCMEAMEKPEASTYEATTDERAKSGDIDPTSNLVKHNVFLFSGKDDTTVKQPVMDALNDYYKHYITDGNVVYESSMAAAHTQPTDDPANTNACTVSKSPYLSNCQYDGAGKALNTIFSDLNPRNEGTLSGHLVEFSQSEFFKESDSMANTGFVYVPADCAAGSRCRLHVSFHGCEQDYTAVGDAYTAHSGYSKWADTNSMIVLYPQTKKSEFAPSNPNGCYDWWGFAGKDYDVQSGDQMSGVRKMIERITSGHPALPAPQDVHVTGSTDSSIALAWDDVKGATGYQIQRDGVVVADALTANFNDTGLQSGTTYSFIVAGVVNNATGTAAPAVAGKTSGTPPPPPPISPPAGLNVTGATNTSLTISWDAVTGAVSYDVYVDHAKAGSGVAGTSYVQTDLQPESTYELQVSAVDDQGKESDKSAPINGTTKSSFTCQTYTASNYAHVQAGRAHDVAGHAHAVGSEQDMGLDNTFYKTTLAETKSDYYVIGQCP